MSKKKAEEVQEPEAPVAVAEPAVEADRESKDSRNDVIYPGRDTAVCRCGEKLVRPVKPANSTWRCLKVWNGQPTADCQKGIPTEKVLDKKQLAALEAARKDRYADGEDVG